MFRLRRTAWIAFVALCASASWSVRAARALEGEQREIHILYTGSTGGVSSGLSDTPEFQALPEALRAAGHAATAVGIGPGALLRDGRYLLRPDRNARVEEWRVLLEEGATERVLVSEAHPVLISPFSVITQFPVAGRPDYLASFLEQAGERFPDLQRREVPLYRYRSSDGADYLALDIYGDAGPTPIENNMLAWETKWTGIVHAGAGTTRASVIGVARFLGGGPKMVRALRDLKSALRPQRTVVVDAGRSVEGAGGTDETLGRARDLSFSQLGALGYHVMVPSGPELVEGVEPLIARADEDGLAYIAADLFVRTEPDDEVVPVFPRWHISTRAGMRILFLGLVGEHALLHVKPSLVRNVEIRDPVEALRSALDAFYAQGGRADLHVVVTAAGGELVEQVRREALGVDVILAEFDDPSALSPERTVDFSATPARLRRHRQPLLICRSGGHKIGVLTARWVEERGRWVLRELRDRVHAITEDYPRDQGLRLRLKRDLMDALYGNQALLLPPADQALRGETDHGRYAPEQLGHIVGHVMREHAGAQVAITRRLAMRVNSVGPVSEYFLRSWLSYPESLLSTILTGAQIAKLARLQPEAFSLVVTGYDPDGRGGAGELGGRALNPAARYRVVLTDFVAEQPEVAEVIGSAPLFEVPAGDDLTDLVVRRLAALREEAAQVEEEAAWLGYIRSRSAIGASGLDPTWLFQLPELSLNFDNYSAINTEDFTASTEARVKNPSQWGIGASSRLKLTYDGINFAGDIGGELRYAQVRQFNRSDNVWVESETQDDLKGISELRLKVAALEFGVVDAPISVQPFVSAVYDTELTGPEAANGAPPAPRQRVAFSNVGLGLFTDWLFQEVRLAAQARWDIARDTFDPGVEASGVSTIGLPGAVSWRNEGRLLWVPTYRDREENTELVIQARSSVAVPLYYSGLALKANIDVYMFRGEAAGRSQIGQSIIYNLAVSYGRTFDLTHGVDY